MLCHNLPRGSIEKVRPTRAVGVTARPTTARARCGYPALAALASSTFAGGPPLCPDIYAPVICSNGKIYPNQCYADRAKAKNCVPYGDI